MDPSCPKFGTARDRSGRSRWATQIEDDLAPEDLPHLEGRDAVVASAAMQLVARFEGK